MLDVGNRLPNAKFIATVRQEGREEEEGARATALTGAGQRIPPIIFGGLTVIPGEFMDAGSDDQEVWCGVVV